MGTGETIVSFDCSWKSKNRSQWWGLWEVTLQSDSCDQYSVELYWGIQENYKVEIVKRNRRRREPILRGLCRTICVILEKSSIFDAKWIVMSSLNYVDHMSVALFHSLKGNMFLEGIGKRSNRKRTSFTRDALTYANDCK